MKYLTLGFSLASFIAAGVIALTTTARAGPPPAPMVFVPELTSSQGQPGLPAAAPALR
ncbi:hypothetical protein [Phenylobacterium sp.]|uniref:hypothetical protein n=1 Tax=Phenylobacterium sp. TaxID=1871053 RepID=UPI0028A1B060|nr:hypothetical protein [Phenylobacterium sp.]